MIVNYYLSCLCLTRSSAPYDLLFHEKRTQFNQHTLYDQHNDFINVLNHFFLQLIERDKNG